MSFRLGIDGYTATSDYAEGYFALLLPAIGLSILLWTLLRVSRGAEVTQQFLRVVAGFTATGVAPLWWVWFLSVQGAFAGWGSLHGLFLLVEVAVALALTAGYVLRRWARSTTVALAAVMLHYVFWLFQFTGSWQYFGHTGPTIAACASLAWVFFVSETNKTAAKACTDVPGAL